MASSHSSAECPALGTRKERQRRGEGFMSVDYRPGDTRVPMSRNRMTDTRSPLKTNPRAGPLIAKPSSRAAAISFGGRILDIRNRSFAYLSARPDSSDGKQIGAASALDRWALKKRTLPSELLSAFRATAASSGLASVGWPSVRLITSGGKESG